MEEMRPEEIRLVFSQGRLGHLGLASDGHAYVVPIFYAYDGKTIYFHSHPGLKDAFIDATDEACLAVTSVATADVWESVLAFGPVEEVTLTQERLVAMDLLLQVPYPPNLGRSPFGNPARSERDVKIWKIVPRTMTGRLSAVPPSTA